MKLLKTTEQTDLFENQKAAAMDQILYFINFLLHQEYFWRKSEQSPYRKPSDKCSIDKDIVIRGWNNRSKTRNAVVLGRL
jgi:hypothetical protein